MKIKLARSGSTVETAAGLELDRGVLDPEPGREQPTDTAQHGTMIGALTDDGVQRHQRPAMS